MTKFNVGDSFMYISEKNTGFFTTNQNYEVLDTFIAGVSLKDNYGKPHKITFNYLNKNFKLADSKPTKNQRIAALEKEVAELKLIVHELRDRPQLTTVVNNINEPSTINDVEDIIEFEGAKYRKVERKAYEGDVVIIKKMNEFSNAFEINKPYKVLKGLSIQSDNPGHGNKLYCVYSKFVNRTTETVNTYELIKDKPLSPNEQRAQIIEDAKKFVEENQDGFKFAVKERIMNCIRTDWSEKGHWVILMGESKCNPSDVFNEHIGKAIALGRALGIDVSEFEQAVQPTIAVGQIVQRYSENGESIGTLKVDKFEEIVEGEVKTYETNTHVINGRLGYGVGHGDRITNDTNAKYLEVE